MLELYPSNSQIVMPDSPHQYQAPPTAAGLGPSAVTFKNLSVQNHPQQLSSASSYTDLPYLFGVQDPAMLAPKPNRNRRKSSRGPEHTKHRRTRSGCYTCRSRRVKCDETHPICERCKKGGRECVYPEAPASSKSSTGGSLKGGKNALRESPDHSSEEYEDEADVEHMKAIPDEGETLQDGNRLHTTSAVEPPPSSGNLSLTGPKSGTRHSSETPSLVQDKGTSPTPSTEGSIGYSSYQPGLDPRAKMQNISSSTSSDTIRSDWSHLPQDLQFYLTYFYENVTHHHYSLKYDSGNFMRTSFLDAALKNEALLYAVVGFAAFQATLHSPTGRIQDFLGYYNKAVSLLLKSLRKGERRSTGTILAILQLATIEEFLGDWINLLGHQKAALEILTELYTPQTVMESEVSRVILGWYVRFDIFVGFMGGFETVLSREWFCYAQEFFREQIVREPNNLSWKIEESIANLRLIAMDLSILFARMGKGEIAYDQFLRENEEVGKRIADWKNNMDPALQDSRFLVTDFTGARALDPDDIVDPYIPGTIYKGPLWVINIQTIDWYSIDLMHKYKTALTMKTQPSAELALIAYASCQLFEAIEFFPESHGGSILACQASLGISLLFLPRDTTHAMWARRKLATIESHGYIYPYTFRTKMSDLFQDRSCMHWWLPNDEGYPQIIRSIRKFVEERTSPVKDVSTEDLRDMKAIFSSMKLDDEKPSLPSNTENEKGPSAEVAVASAHDWTGSNLGQGNMEDLGETNMGLSDGYPLGFDDGQAYWGESQHGGPLGLSKPGDYP